MLQPSQRQLRLQKEGQQDGNRAGKGVHEHDPARARLRKQEIHRLAHAMPDPHPHAFFHVHRFNSHFHQRKRQKHAHEIHRSIQQIGDPVAQHQRQACQQRGACAAHAIDHHIRRAVAQIAFLFSLDFQAVIRQRFSRAGFKVITERAKHQRHAHIRQPTRKRHQQRGDQTHQLAAHQRILPAEHIRNHAGGHLKQQARHMKNTLCHADFHHGKPARRQQRHPYAAQAKAAHRRQAQQLRHLKSQFLHNKNSLSKSD